MTKQQWKQVWHIFYKQLLDPLYILSVTIYAIMLFFQNRIQEALLAFILAQLMVITWEAKKK